MPTYTVDLDITGTVAIVIEGDDEDDAMDRAEQLLTDSEFPRLKREGALVTIQIGSAEPQQATEEK